MKSQTFDKDEEIVRMTIRTTHKRRRAIHIIAAERGVSVNLLVNEIFDDFLALQLHNFTTCNQIEV